MSSQILFVVAPFLPEHQPSLGVSTLVQVVRDAGFTASVRYLNVQFMRQIGWDLYYYLSYATPPELIRGEMALLPASPELLLGEMVFAPALFGPNATDWEAYAERIAPILRNKEHAPIAGGDVHREQTLLWESARPKIAALRAEVPAIVARWAQEILSANPRVVGFTSTFQQNLASLALAKELRRHRTPEELTILLGGANCEGDMGAALADNFPFLDHVVAGEGEGAVVDLIRAALDPSGPRPPRLVHGPSVNDMNSLPTPDFDDYFEAVRGTQLSARSNLTAESSRGCWWGARAHCTFCGLNGSSMAYRSKDAERFVAELRHLADRYGSTFFMMADNILDLKYIRSVFPALIEQGDTLTMFYETKSNLRKDQVEVLAAGGVTELQPGIESLSSPILKLMAKGTTRLRNLQLLKWCEEYRVRVNWNILYGFPAEQPAEYDQMAALIPSLVHLPPPGGGGRIRLDRFAPYWKTPDKYGIVDVRQLWTYDAVYTPLPEAERARVAYYFDYNHADGRNPDTYAAAVLAEAESWRDRYSSSATLELQRCGTDLAILDTRHGGREETPISDADERLLFAFDAMRSLAGARESLNGDAPSAEDAAIKVEDWLEKGWVIGENGSYLSLVLDRELRQRVIQLKMRAQLGLIDWSHLDRSDSKAM